MSGEKQGCAQDRPWSISRAYFAAGKYSHPPSGLLQLRVVRRGSSHAVIDLGAGRRQVFTRPGDLLITLPDKPTQYEIDDGRELTMIEVLPEYGETVLREMGYLGLGALTPLLRKPVRDALVAELCRRLEEPHAPAILQEWTMRVILGNLVRKAAAITGAATHSVLTATGLRTVDALIMRRSDETLSVARLAEAVGLSPRRFSTEFREATGLPVHQYILKLRADRAVELLTGSDLPLSQVAAQSGFSHQAHMSRVLRRMRGQTPGAFRALRRI